MDLREGDVLAVRLSPGPEWLDVLRRAWTARAALLPVDVRLPASSVASLLARGQPTCLLDSGGFRRLDGGLPTDGSLALVMPTSGTTDEPKLAELTFEAVRAQVSASNEALGIPASDPWLCCLPLGHIGGLLVALRSVAADTPVAVHPGFDVGAFKAELQSRLTSLVPTMLYRLLEAGADLGRFEAILVGGGALDAALADRAAASGACVVTTYGMTETCGGVVYDGRPLPGTGVRLGPGDEVQLQGPSLMRGYRLQGAAPFTTDGWLRTSDAGRLDADGSLRVLGRLDEAIVTGGEKVWPAEVEKTMRARLGVEAAVVGVPDPEWGRRIVALVERADVAVHAVRDALRPHLPAYALPREVLAVEAIPRNEIGKILRDRASALAITLLGTSTRP